MSAGVGHSHLQHSLRLPQSTPLLQGQKLGVVWSVFPLAPPTSPAPAKAKERVKGAKNTPWEQPGGEVVDGPVNLMQSKTWERP